MHSLIPAADGTQSQGAVLTFFLSYQTPMPRYWQYVNDKQDFWFNIVCL